MRFRLTWVRTDYYTLVCVCVLPYWVHSLMQHCWTGGQTDVHVFLSNTNIQPFYISLSFTFLLSPSPTISLTRLPASYFHLSHLHILLKLLFPSKSLPSTSLYPCCLPPRHPLHPLRSPPPITPPQPWKTISTIISFLFGATRQRRDRRQA